MLDPARTTLVIVDIQVRMMPAIAEADRVTAQVCLLARGCAVLGIPTVITEQYPKGLGHTLPQVLEATPGASVVEKRSFGAGDCAEFVETLGAERHVLLCGVETHVCVCQSAQQALAQGHAVHLVEDAVGSRVESNRQIGIARMRAAGAVPSSVEMALFELMRTSTHEQFREISKLVR